MTDIVRSLRALYSTHPIVMEAANEIERLRATLLKIDKFIVAIAPKPTKEHVAICREIQHALGRSEG